MWYRLVLLGILLGLLPAAPAAAQGARCFPETGFCIAGPIRSYWERNGGLPIFGYPIGPLQDEVVRNDDGTVAWRGPTQWFERDRLEDHSAQGQGVLAGRLGAEQLRDLTVSLVIPRPTPVGGAAPGCRWFPETGHSVCPPFLAYWERNGGLERFGYPLSEPFAFTVGAYSGTVQYFERRRMELHRIFPPGFDTVLLGLLGNELRNNQPSAVCTGPQLPAELTRTLESVPFRFQLGCPIGAQSDVALAEQYYERGTMVWVASTDLVGTAPAIYTTRTSPQPLAASRFPDTYVEGTPEPPTRAPAGLYAPIRGFGKIWREQQGVREALGWAIEPERAARGVFVPYTSGGAIVWLQGSDFVYIFAANGQATASPRRR